MAPHVRSNMCAPPPLLSSFRVTASLFEPGRSHTTPHPETCMIDTIHTTPVDTIHTTPGDMPGTVGLRLEIEIRD
eukprot:1373020-Pyramimonas_sp.AAC.1